jgi:two-component system cell cycle sensor histidine kinase/response regulator CckA
VLGTARKILLVDDDPSIVMLARLTLERRGHQVTAFSDAGEALRAFAADPDAFDLVVSDLAMPGVSGFQVAREVLAIRPDVPVVLASGAVSDEEERAASEAGARAVILKPRLLQDPATWLES